MTNTNEIVHTLLDRARAAANQTAIQLELTPLMDSSEPASNLTVETPRSDPGTRAAVNAGEEACQG